MSTFVTFGDSTLPGPSGGVSIKIKYKATGKVDEKEHDGADDGTATWKGRKPRDVEISLTWIYKSRATDPVGGVVHQEVCDVLDAITCAGPDAGKSFDFAESDDRAQKIANVKSVLVKEIELDPPDHDKGLRSAKIGCDSWSKPKDAKQSATTDATETPSDPQKWHSAEAQSVQNFGGQKGNTVTFPTAPKVVP